MKRNFVEFGIPHFWNLTIWSLWSRRRIRHELVMLVLAPEQSRTQLEKRDTIEICWNQAKKMNDWQWKRIPPPPLSSFFDPLVASCLKMKPITREQG